jgi:hypothetical protein
MKHTFGINKTVVFICVSVLLALFLVSRVNTKGDTIISSAVTNGVTIQATGTAFAIPDAVKIYFTVSAKAATSSAALDETSTVADKIREVLNDSDVKEKDIATQTVSVYPEYVYPQDGVQTLEGYRATQSFEVLIRKADSAGAVLDDIVKVGGDLVQISSVTSVVLETSKAAIAAREDAVSNALIKAESYAKLLDAQLGQIEFITETSSPYSGPGIFEGAVSSDSKTPTQIDLGEQQITVTIEVRWALK